MEDPIGFYVIFAHVGKRLRKVIEKLELRICSSMYASIFDDFTTNNLRDDCKLFPLDSGASFL